jgi:hypothetical protein
MSLITLIKDFFLPKEEIHYVTQHDLSTYQTIIETSLYEDRKSISKLIDKNNLQLGEVITRELNTQFHAHLKEFSQTLESEILEKCAKIVSEKITAVSLDLSKVYEENISSITRKSKAIANVIEKSKAEITEIVSQLKNNYQHDGIKAITNRLATMDQQIKALQNGKAK